MLINLRVNHVLVVWCIFDIILNIISYVYVFTSLYLPTLFKVTWSWTLTVWILQCFFTDAFRSSSAEYLFLNFAIYRS